MKLSADDMGLGKTLTMISLILKTSEMFGHLKDEDLLCTGMYYFILHPIYVVKY